MALPAPLQELWTAWGDIQGNANHPVMVNVVGPAGEYRDGLKQLLLSQGGKAGCVRVVEGSMEVPPEADIHLVMLDPAFGPTTTQANMLRKVNPKGLLLVMIGGDESQFESRKREVATAVGVRTTHVIAVKTLSQLRGVLAKRLLTTFDEWVVPLARQFPFLRDDAANQEINSTSQQNAMVGAMPIPGADMPIMTANQVKMILRLAAIHDQPMTLDRAKEVLAVVGSGLALRTAARQLAKMIPGPGWIVGGALGYGGTLAIGKGAVEYFRRVSGGAPRTPATPKSGRARDAVIDTEAEVVDPR
ncbi:MAG: hypothetical protein JWM80_1420 [Cyanobacteria bacterium RYN_339]|nr:hypothetical protein [Cyanobacteria bacterium RYN_339]